MCSLDSVWEEKHSRDFIYTDVGAGSQAFYAHIGGYQVRDNGQQKTGFKIP